MGKRIVIVGAGAVGGYTGAHIAQAGEDVTFIDPWPEHVEEIKKNGLRITHHQGPEAFTARPRALHLTEAQHLSKEAPVDIAFICMKSYDTHWAALMIRQYEEVQRTIRYSCEIPVEIEGRLGRFAQALQRAGG